MTKYLPAVITESDTFWPKAICDRLGASSPSVLNAIGDVTILGADKTALFCSAKTPSDAILPAHNRARRLRDSGQTVISGFQSPIEKQCLNILLRGTQSLIICPARSITNMRITAELRKPLEDGRLLIISPFLDKPTRVTRAAAVKRNELVVAMADSIFIPHKEPGSQTAHIADLAKSWNIPFVPVE